MACAGLKNQNSFGLLDTLNLPPPNELSQAQLQQSSLRKGTAQDFTPVVFKSQPNGHQRHDRRRQCNAARPNVYKSSKLAETRDRNNPSRQDKGFKCYPATLPPRSQNKPIESRVASQGFCEPTSRWAVPELYMELWSISSSLARPCSGVIDPCLTGTSPCSGNELLNIQLKQQVFMLLQKQPSATCPEIMNNGPPAIISSESNQSTDKASNLSPSTLMRRSVEREQPCPVLHTLRSTNPPTHPSNKLNMSPLTPPGLPKLSGRGATRSNAGTLMKPVIDPSDKLNVNLPPPFGLPKPSRRTSCDGTSTSMKPINHAVDDCFERYNGPAITSRVISPPPPAVTPHTVKLPARKDIQQVPRSPTTSASSLSEEQSGSSSTLWSDTTFTTVDSNISSQVHSNQKISQEICRRWMNGNPCYRIPCPYDHPVRPNQLVNPAMQLTQSLSPPHRSIVKTSVRIRDQTNSAITRKNGPRSGDGKLLRREPLYVTTIADHIKVRFDHGFEVREVVTGFESRWAHLGNIDGNVTSTALKELLGPYKVDNINLPESLAGKPVTAKAQFASSADAIKAVTDLNGVEFAKRTITAKLAINNSIHGSTVLTDTDVQLAWECPFRVGYAGYDTLKEAKAALDSLNGFSMEYLVVSAQLYEGLPCVGAYNVIFKQLPPSVTEQDLRKFANSKAVMLGRPNYQSLDKAISSIRFRLEEYGSITSFDTLPPPYKDGMVKAWARFTSPTEACAAQDDLDRRRPKAIGYTTLSCRRVVSVSHVLGAASYKKMREDIGWLRWSWQRRYGPSVSIRERVKENVDDDAPVYIKLSSEQPELLSSLKYEFEQLLHGETITLEKKPLWDDFLIAEAGHAFITQVQAQYPGVQIQVQKDRRVISLWGPIVMRHRARQDIVRKIMELKAQQFWKIPLSGKLLGIFCSAELCTLQELLGPENCILDFEERVLVVRGNDGAYRTACKAVQDAQKSRQGDSPGPSNADCPVCFGEAVVPVSLACGHQWCRACLTSYLTSAVENKTFPLKCLGNDAACAECIPLGLSRKLLSAADFNAVVEAAFWLYVHSRQDEFHHCPTPDCTQVYRTAPPNAVLQCPSCLVRICPACRIKYHDGMTCEERDVAEDKLFNEWTLNHDVQSCPGCKVPIERSEGCNHMTCTRCQTHICWECLATFPKGQGIYEHMRAEHGGIGL